MGFLDANTKGFYGMSRTESPQAAASHSSTVQYSRGKLFLLIPYWYSSTKLLGEKGKLTFPVSSEIQSRHELSNPLSLCHTIDSRSSSSPATGQECGKETTDYAILCCTEFRCFISRKDPLTCFQTLVPST